MLAVAEGGDVGGFSREDGEGVFDEASGERDGVGLEVEVAAEGIGPQVNVAVRGANLEGLTLDFRLFLARE